MQENTSSHEELRTSLRRRQPNRLVEAIGFLGVLGCVLVGIRIGHLPLEEPVRPMKELKDIPFHPPIGEPEPFPVRGAAVLLGGGAFLGLIVGVSAFWVILYLLGYHRKPVESPTIVKAYALDDEQLQARARQRQLEAEKWNAASTPPRSDLPED